MMLKRNLRVVDFTKRPINMASRDGTNDHKLVITNQIEVDGQSRINKAVFTRYEEHEAAELAETVFLKIINGRDIDTGRQRQCSIRLSKKDLKTLKKWLDLVDKSE